MGEEDILLARSLRRKVDQLYGSSDYRAVVRPGEQRIGERSAADEEAEVRSAWGFVLSVGVAAVVSIAGFAALVQVGAVHDSGRVERTYEMPAYGTGSYVNPYELLDKEFGEIDK